MEDWRGRTSLATGAPVAVEGFDVLPDGLNDIEHFPAIGIVEAEVVEVGAEIAGFLVPVHLIVQE